jgi:CRISPR-associated endoribonuclease Cas6
MFVNMKISRVTFQELIEDAKPVIRFGFSFVTPCQFKIRNVNFPIIFPEPRLLFPRLAKLWNKHAPESKVDKDELYSFVSDNVYVRDYDLITREVRLGKGISFVGCTGQCGYAVKTPEDSYSLWLDILGHFGEYTNIGDKRTAGLGVVNYSRLKVLQKSNNEM